MDALIKVLVLALSESQGGPESKYAGARRFAAAIIFSAVAIVVAAGALGCAVAALWIYLSSALNPLAAAIGCTVMLLLVGLILAIVAGSLFRDEPRANAGKEDLRVELLQDVLRGFERNKGAFLLAALVAGIAAGSKPRNK